MIVSFIEHCILLTVWRFGLGATNPHHPGRYQSPFRIPGVCDVCDQARHICIVSYPLFLPEYINEALGSLMGHFNILYPPPIT
jgi:hypothetical protein